ncbi:MAG: extracellular solute-binding protein [Oscillospiraceae bacterium]|nr:extracellular solute-binding protein [Oscillospiraceae bacterium]
MKKIVSFILISSAILIMLLSCGSDQNDDNSAANDPEANSAENNSGGESEETTENDIYNMKARENAKDGLPEMDFRGEAFTVLQRSEWNYEFLAESENGDVVNDAVYKRNLTVEERFNVKIETIETAGIWGQQDNFVKKVTNTVAAGDDEYNIIAGYAAYMPRLQSAGHVVNLNELPYLSFDKPWWSKDLMDNLTINGKLFFTTGDIALSLWEDILAVYFNKQMIQDYAVENPYELVRSGKWTIDKLNEICKNVYSDVDGDGKPSANTDIFGYATDTANLVDNFFNAFGEPAIKKDGNGVVYLAQNTQKMTDITEKMHDFLWNNQGVYANPVASAEPENLYKYIFEEGRAMFLPEHLGNASTLRSMETDFGIIPYPKWNEQQENYLTAPVAYFSLIAVPTTAQNLEMTGMITEALCVESYKKVIPAFYEISLKTKYSRDEESAEMIDIIRNGVVFDFGAIYCTQLDTAFHLFRILMSDKKNNWVSQFEKNEPRYNKLLEKLIETFE